MRTLTLLFILLSSLFSVKAQKITPIEPSMSDALFILKSMGIEMVRFDLSTLQQNTFEISIYIDEYIDGVKQERKLDRNLGKNREILSEDIAADFIAAKSENFDTVNNVLLRHKDIGIYILPENDSVVTCRINLTDGATLSTPLPLKELKPTSPRFRFSYEMRPFSVNEFNQSSSEIPLMLYASYWYDDKSYFYRFCGEKMIDPEMNSDSNILTYSPHYYVIGISVVKVL